MTGQSPELDPPESSLATSIVEQSVFFSRFSAQEKYLVICGLMDVIDCLRLILPIPSRTLSQTRTREIVASEQLSGLVNMMKDDFIPECSRLGLKDHQLRIAVTKSVSSAVYLYSAGASSHIEYAARMSRVRHADQHTASAILTGRTYRTTPQNRVSRKMTEFLSTP